MRESIGRDTDLKLEVSERKMGVIAFVRGLNPLSSQVRQRDTNLIGCWTYMEVAFKGFVIGEKGKHHRFRSKSLRTVSRASWQ